MPRQIRSALAVVVVVALAAVSLPLALPSASAEPSDRIFAKLKGFKASGAKVRVDPRRYSAVRVDSAGVRAELADAPAVGSSRAVVVELPTPTGGSERFAVQRTTVMQAKLAAAHPELQTWAGVSLDHGGTSVALDVTPMGFHASVRGPNGQGAWFIDPAYNKRGTSEHLVYYGRSVSKPTDSPVERELPVIDRTIQSQRSKARASAGPTVVQRTYRLALLSDPSYANYFGSQNVLAEKVTLMTRVNQVYNDDLAIRMVLVEGTEQLNLDTVEKATGPDGPCGTHPCYTLDPDSPDYVEGQLSYCDVGTLQRNQIVLGQLIGASHYDIGHIALGTNGGGIAGLGVVGSIEKAMGCTGVPDPVGDYYAIDYVAHEMGHQFAGNHTFNGTQWNCSGANRNQDTSVEPGSGTSIMAYAGICRQDNLQPHSDPYFSQRSISEINAYSSGDAPDPVEVQDVSLTGFDAAGDTITIDYPDASADPVTLRFGSTYTAANLEAAIEELTGENVTIAKWGYDPYAGIYSDPQVYPAPVGEPDKAGFQVIFAADPDPYTDNSDRADMQPLTVQTSDGVSAHIGETAKGGPANNNGEAHATGNRHPSVKAPANRTLPLRTPFTLRGSGRDADGDKLTFLWEQNDIGGNDGTALVDNNKNNGPLFRVFGQYADVSDEDAMLSPAPNQNTAGTQPWRTFPDMGQILAGNTNAKTGTCPAAPPDDPDTYVVVPVPIVNCYSEFLPVRGYMGDAGSKNPTMHFRLTARDTTAGGGGVGHADVTLRIDQTAGPFLVSSFNNGGSVKAGSTKTIVWKVNGTRKLAANVRIVLSTDNGRTWSKVLARKTANDGKARVRLPKGKTDRAWIMVQAVDNYFFDVSDTPFQIR
jgi:hypothetical protein